MKVAFFHGLESDPQSDKNIALGKKFDFVYEPPMNYYEAGLFNKVLQEVKKNKIDLLIGSSMGGWFAYAISTHTGIPTLLFNPAVQGRSMAKMDPVVTLGSQSANHTIVFGSKDDVIIPEDSVMWFKQNGIGSLNYNWESNGHRTPLAIFKKWINRMAKTNESAIVKTYESWLSEMDIPSNKWVDTNLKTLSSEDVAIIWKMYTDTYAKEGMDFSADDQTELQSKYKATFLRDVDSDHVADAFIVYKETPYGNKIALLGTNDKKEAKREVVKKVIELLNTRGWFIEASLKMEEILAKSSVPVINNEKMVNDIVGADKKPEMETDGYYTRLLSKASKRIRKRLYGIPK